MKTCVLAVVLMVAVGAIGAAPATGPATTKPALIDLKPLQDRVAEAQSAVDRAKADAHAKWEASDEYRRLAGDVQRTKKALDEARAGDDSKLKLDTSAAYNAARAELAAAETKAMKGAALDEERAAYQRRLDLESAKAENARRLAAIDNPLSRPTKLAMGMTVDEADKVMGGRLKRGGRIFTKSESVTAYEVELSNRHNFIDNTRDTEGPGVYKFYLSFRDGKLAKMWRGPTDTSEQIND